MKISVVIPTYNAEEHLPVLFEKLKAQSIAFELVIIDSSSTDTTPTLAKKAADTLLTIPKKTFDHGGTRTIAAKKATGDIIVFLTQDAVPCSDTAGNFWTKRNTVLKPHFFQTVFRHTKKRCLKK